MNRPACAGCCSPISTRTTPAPQPRSPPGATWRCARTTPTRLSSAARRLGRPRIWPTGNGPSLSRSAASYRRRRQRPCGSIANWTTVTSSTSAPSRWPSPATPPAASRSTFPGHVSCSLGTRWLADPTGRSCSACSIRTPLRQPLPSTGWPPSTPRSPVSATQNRSPTAQRPSYGRPPSSSPATKSDIAASSKRWRGSTFAKQPRPPQLSGARRVAAQPSGSGCLLGLTRQTVLDGVPDQFDPVVQVELAERVLHVVLHGAVGQHEPGGDLLVGPAGGDHAEDLGLAFGQPRRVRAVPGGRGGQPPELAEYQRGEPGGEHRVAVGRAPHRIEEFRACRGLQQVADRARLHRVEHVLLFPARGQDQHAHRRMARASANDV